MFDAEKYNWEKHDAKMKECAAIRKDCSVVRGLISEAMQRYIKKKLNARNKKLAADMELMFADLADYRSERDIQDAYGYDYISEREYDRLINLWRMREKYVDDNGKFSDRVTELLQIAINSVGEQYYDFLAETDEADRFKAERRTEIERENAQYRYEQYVKGLKRGTGE